MTFNHLAFRLCIPCVKLRERVFAPLSEPSHLIDCKVEIRRENNILRNPSLLPEVPRGRFFAPVVSVFSWTCVQWRCCAIDDFSDFTSNYSDIYAMVDLRNRYYCDLKGVTKAESQDDVGLSAEHREPRCVSPSSGRGLLSRKVDFSCAV